MTPIWFVNIYLIPTILLCSLLQDSYITGRGSWGVGLVIGLFFGIFVLSSARTDLQFHIYWIPGFAASLLFVASWSDTLSIPYIISTSIFTVLALLFASKAFFGRDTETAVFALFFLGFSVFMLLASTVTPQTSLAAVVYIYSALAFIQVYLLPAGNGLKKALFFVYWGMASLFFIIASRRWSGSSHTPYYLIVLPLISVCLSQIVAYKGGM